MSRPSSLQSTQLRKRKTNHHLIYEENRSKRAGFLFLFQSVSSSGDAGTEGVETSFDVLVAAVYLLDVVDGGGAVG